MYGSNENSSRIEAQLKKEDAVYRKTPFLEGNLYSIFTSTPSLKMIDLSYKNELDNDETAFFVFQEMLDGNKSNIDVASKLGIEVKDVENARKRIKRKALNITAK